MCHWVENEDQFSTLREFEEKIHKPSEGEAGMCSYHGKFDCE